MRKALPRSLEETGAVEDVVLVTGGQWTEGSSPGQSHDENLQVKEIIIH